MNARPVPSIQTLNARIAASQATADQLRQLASTAAAMESEVLKDEAHRLEAMAGEYDADVDDCFETLAENYSYEEVDAVG